MSSAIAMDVGSSVSVYLGERVRWVGVVEEWPSETITTPIWDRR